MDLWNHITLHDISTVFTVHSLKGRRFTMQNRPAYALSFAVGDAEIVYTHNGTQFVSDAAHAVLIPMGADYTLFCRRSGDFPLINFTADVPLGDFAVTPIRSVQSYLSDYERLRALWIERKHRAQAFHMLYEIFGKLSHEGDDRSMLPVRNAAESLSLHFSDPTLSVLRLAEESGLSEVYFRRLFKSVYGVPPKQYLHTLRIRHAQLMLREGKESITRIAEACGFSSVYHFCRAFREETGDSPTEYRRSQSF
jgi:AraC-like DNA-binding protein